MMRIIAKRGNQLIKVDASSGMSPLSKAAKKPHINALPKMTTKPMLKMMVRRFT